MRSRSAATTAAPCSNAVRVVSIAMPVTPSAAAYSSARSTCAADWGWRHSSSTITISQNRSRASSPGSAVRDLGRVQRGHRREVEVGPLPQVGDERPQDCELLVGGAAVDIDGAEEPGDEHVGVVRCEVLRFHGARPYAPGTSMSSVSAKPRNRESHIAPIVRSDELETGPDKFFFVYFV